MPKILTCLVEYLVAKFDANFDKDEETVDYVEHYFVILLVCCKLTKL